MCRYTWTFHGPANTTPAGHKLFHFGMLDAHQRHILRCETEQVLGNPVAFTERGLMLESGEEVECDTVIWATGYKTGLDAIEYEKAHQIHFCVENLLDRSVLRLHESLRSPSAAVSVH